MTTCSRSGCTKKLRSNNTTGMCGSACLSPDAPPSIRAKVAKATEVSEVTPATPTEGSALARFRLVAGALGVDADGELEVFAQAWLDGLKAKLEE